MPKFKKKKMWKKPYSAHENVLQPILIIKTNCCVVILVTVFAIVFLNFSQQFSLL